MPKTCSDLKRLSLNGPTMATRWSVLCDVAGPTDQAALQQALAAAVDQVDQQMSPWKPDSDLMRLNRAAPGEWVSLSPEIMAVLALVVVSQHVVPIKSKASGGRQVVGG